MPARGSSVEVADWVGGGREVGGSPLMKGNNRREMAAFQVPFGGHLDFHFIEPLSHNGATVFHTLVIRFDFLFFFSFWRLCSVVN